MKSWRSQSSSSFHEAAGGARERGGHRRERRGAARVAECDVAIVGVLVPADNGDRVGDETEETEPVAPARRGRRCRERRARTSPTHWARCAGRPRRTRRRDAMSPTWSARSSSSTGACRAVQRAIIRLSRSPPRACHAPGGGAAGWRADVAVACSPGCSPGGGVCMRQPGGGQAWSRPLRRRGAPPRGCQEPSRRLARR